MKLTTHTESEHAIKAKWQQKLQFLLGCHVIGSGQTNLAQALVNALSEQGKSVTFAESCTGGLMSSLLTRVAGCSEVFSAGFVTYSNSIKSKIIGVSEQTIAQHGAVSEQVVSAMARGALKQSGADYVVAVSGIAGPGGGSESKPVGTVWLAWGSADCINTVGLLIAMPRERFQYYVAAVGLDLIRRDVLSLTDEPHYVTQRRIK